MKRMYFIFFLILSGIFLLTACAAPEGNSPGTQSPSTETLAPVVTPAATADGGQAYHKITAEEAKTMMDAGGVTIVDVRTEQEYAEKHIPGAVLVPNESIGSAPPEQLPDQDAVLLVHCRTGVRSKQASDKLIKLGYRHVYDFGGIVSWQYETESGADK